MEAESEKVENKKPIKHNFKNNMAKKLITITKIVSISSFEIVKLRQSS